MIIDAHMHLWDKVAGRLGEDRIQPLENGKILIGNKLVQGMPTFFSDCRSTAERALAVFEDAGVDTAVVTQEFLDGNQNEYLAKVKSDYPDKFFVHGLLDFTRPAGLAAEMKKLLEQGFKGIKCPAMHLTSLPAPVTLDQRELMQVWEEMASKNMILSIDLAPGDTQVGQLRSVIETFPTLRIAIGHFGMVGNGDWMSQIRLAKYENVYIESGGIIWLFREEGPPFTSAQSKIEQAYQEVGSEKLMWGSDYPRTMVDFTYRQSLNYAVTGCSFFSASERDAFLGGNAARVYDFPYAKEKKTPHTLITEL